MNNNTNITNIVSFLQNTKKIFNRILLDVHTYQDLLTEYFNKHETHINDKNNAIKKLKIISEIFYKSFFNHLSVVNIDNGFEKLIKSVAVNEKENTIKYRGLIKIFGEKYTQTNITVATIDNISINKIYDEKNIKSIIGYELCIGKNKYFMDEIYENNINNIDIFIENRKIILENIEISLITNIDFITKYYNAFLMNIK